MTYAEFVLRTEAAALRQLLTVDAVAFGTGGLGEQGALHLTLLRSVARA